VLRLVVAALAAAGGGTVVLSRRGRWTKRPLITVIAAAEDSRIAFVREAVDSWNRTFAELGTPFRLGELTVVEGSVPDADVLALGPRWSPTMPESLEHYAGDVLLVLSGASFISCTAPRGRRMVIAIKSQADFPLTLPNVARNVIAHELGHAIGLKHNSDPALLMCGRPAPCRPDLFQSEEPRFFPLSAEEKAQLLALYPADWTER
jgi:hypothetical protein